MLGVVEDVIGYTLVILCIPDDVFIIITLPNSLGRFFIFLPNDPRYR